MKLNLNDILGIYNCLITLESGYLKYTTTKKIQAVKISLKKKDLLQFFTDAFKNYTDLKKNHRVAYCVHSFLICDF